MLFFLCLKPSIVRKTYFCDLLYHEVAYFLESRSKQRLYINVLRYVSNVGHFFLHAWTCHYFFNDHFCPGGIVSSAQPNDIFPQFRPGHCFLRFVLYSQQ